MSMITSQFNAPEFLKPELEQRVTIRVENMKKPVNLPHLILMEAQKKILLQENQETAMHCTLQAATRH